ncbi:MAG: glycoside hydrolase family 3 C-terminal domain-containing protein [Acidobacteriota bacterium]|jgi:beta-glucosidase|nr:glycoside hydrolase family 3 C-terminal domain-containing protein [Acidobacteriota bacterium]
MEKNNAPSKTKNASSKTPDYRNPSLSAPRRVKDLLARMTLKEKAAQMICVWNEKANALVDEKGRFDEQKAAARFKDRAGLGQVGRPSDAGGGRNARETAELTNAIQRFFVEKSRLGIPVIFHEECLHGQAAIDATSFPQPIGLGATFDPELVERVFAATAEEARARGTHQALTPVVDVAREPRWGRVEETYGEDPYLVSMMGVAAVRGFQGDASFKDKKRVIATLKHFAAHGQPESGTNCAPVNVSERVLRETFLATFKQAIEKGGAVSVMASYNEIDGVPSHANEWLLRDVLRKEWGFKGFVVSDYYAVRELDERPELFGNHLAADGKEAAALALKAGVNIELPDPDCYLHIVELVKKGIVKESLIDGLVAPMLLWKFKLGLFDDPYVDPAAAEKTVGCDAHRELALEAARKTVTLLKNEDAAVPLKLDGSKPLKTLAVIGPNADRVLLGGYSGQPKQFVTLLEGIRAYVGAHAGGKVKVLYHEGCKITVGGSWNQDEVTPSDPVADRKSIQDAVRVARKADVVVLALGGNEQTSREAWMSNHMGDRTSLDMVGLQDELVDAVAATGKPVVAFLFNGRPLSVRNLAAKAKALFECWYLGQEAGTAVAEVLFGDVNPGGKLPITIPRSVGHLPAYYNYKPAARRGYLFDDVSPLFPFGFGLSYTKFDLGAPRLEKKVIKKGESTAVRVDVTNVGEVAGEEVVQMYIRDRVSSVTRPVKELKGFGRIRLEPGETATVVFDITPEHLAFYGIDMEYAVEPGEFEVMAGNSSRDEDLKKTVLTVR